eukprot:4456467-Alexandrium_andersonii.AAC.1
MALYDAVVGCTSATLAPMVREAVVLRRLSEFIAEGELDAAADQFDAESTAWCSVSFVEPDHRAGATAAMTAAG